MRTGRKVWGIIAILLGICLLGGCSKNPERIGYTLMEFKKNDVCSRRFSMYYGETERMVLGIEETLYNAKQVAEIENKIDADLKRIEEKFLVPSSQKVEVYIIDTPLESGFYIGDNKVYSTAEAVENNSYRDGLVRAYYGLTEPAMIHGLTAFIFGEKVEVDRLNYYYSTNENLNTLGLFGWRFYKHWNTEEEIQIAKDTATALVTYLVESNQKEMILTQDVGIQVKNAWLQSIGVDRIYENSYEGEFRGFTYSQSKEYPLIMDSEDIRYYMASIDFLDTSEAIEYFLHKDKEGRESILKYLEENAPINFKFIKKEIKPLYSFHQVESDTLVSSVAIGGGKIKLAKYPFAHLHEYIHILTTAQETGKYWMQEGLAEYLSKVIAPSDYAIEIDFSEVDKDNLPKSPEFPEYFETTMAYYHAHGGSFEKDSIDKRLYVDAYAYATLNSEGTWRKGYDPIGQRYNTRGPLQNQGNELSYVQATSFTRYLIETYSLDAYLGYYMGVDLTNSFEDSFGVSYEQAKADWINYLERELVEN